MRLLKERQRFFLLGFFVLLFILVISTYNHYGVPWDEKVYFNGGKYYFKQIFQFLNLKTNLDTSWYEAKIIPYPYHEMSHGFIFDIFVFFVGSFFPGFNFEVLHLIRAILALPIFYLLYLIVSKLTSKVYGLIALVFLLTFPRFYPEIFYNAVDIPAALLFTLCLTYFIYYSGAKKTFLKSIVFGLILGITINQRLLLFYLPLLNFIFLFFIQRKNLKQFFLLQFFTLISLLLSLHLTHPYLLTHPITGLLDVVKSAKQYPWNAGVLFDGQIYQAGVKPLPWYYLPKTMIITIPLITVALFLIGCINIFTNLVRSIQDSTKFNKNLIFFYVAAVFFIPFILVFILKPTLYDFWRQFLFLTIPLIIISVYGLSWIFQLKNKVFKLLIIIFIGLNLTFTLVEMIRLHPLEYLYYNQLVGGLKGAYGKYETDYWGLGYKDAVLWFNKKVNDPKKQYKIFVEGDPLSSSYYFKSNMVLTTDLPTADYLFTFTRWNFHTRHPGKTIYTVEKENVPLIFIKKL